VVELVRELTSHFEGYACGLASDRASFDDRVLDAILEMSRSRRAIVEAMRREALATAHCIATDATGVLAQPDSRPDNQSQPCRRAYFFVLIADADQVFFEYTPMRPVS
jgi:hypothetical protein